MSSSYSSMDWVSSHWADSLCVDIFMFICVYFVCFCFILHRCCIIVSMVGWTWWDWSLILWTYHRSVLWHCWLGHLTRKIPYPIWPIMCLVLYLSIAQVQWNRTVLRITFTVCAPPICTCIRVNRSKNHAIE